MKVSFNWVKINTFIKMVNRQLNLKKVHICTSASDVKKFWSRIAERLRTESDFWIVPGQRDNKNAPLSLSEPSSRRFSIKRRLVISPGIKRRTTDTMARIELPVDRGKKSRVSSKCHMIRIHLSYRDVLDPAEKRCCLWIRLANRWKTYGESLFFCKR